MNTDVALAGVSGLTLVLGALGGYLALRVGRAGRKWMRLGLGSASGFMLSFALLQIMPEALSLTPYAHFMTVAGFAALYVIEHGFQTHFCPSAEEGCPEHGQSIEAVGFFTFLGISIHSLIDGIAIGAALVTSVNMGLLVAAAVILHKVPDGFCLGALLQCKGYKPKSAGTLLGAFSLATPLGALLTYYGLRFGGTVDTGLALGLAAGSFLYVATADMLPEAHTGGDGGREWPIIVAVLVGMAAGSASLLLG